MDCLKSAVAERDVRATHHYAYCIKGPSASLGRVKIANLCEKVASSALHNKWFDADFAFLSLESQFDALRVAMEQLIKTSEGQTKKDKESKTSSGPEAERIAQLEKRLGRNTALAVAEAFLEDTADAIKKVRQGIEDKDEQSLKPVTHRIAGCCASVMDKESQQLANSLQELAEKQSWTEAEKLLQTFLDALERSRTLFKSYLADNS